MGVKGLFSWISKKFPNISKIYTSKEYIFKIDNLYIDFNYLIYNCITSIDSNDMQLLIDRTLQLLYDIVKIISPQKLLFISVDGVSPFAKIFVQRQRRFAGNMNPSKKLSEKCFSKCNITVGTEFSELIHAKLKEFLESMKQELNIEKIIYSSYHTPGEGEYKIFKYIRDNNINKHLNSLFITPDSDVIIYILLNHINNAFIMKNLNNISDAEYQFVIIDITILEQSILQCFDIDKSEDSNIAINDFCKICLLLGNDFIPKFHDFSFYRDDFDTALTLYKKICIDNKKTFKDHFGYYLSELSLACSRKANPSLTKELCEKYGIINFFKKKDPNLDSHERENLLSKVCFSILDCFHWTYSYITNNCISWEFCYPYDYSPSLILLSKYCGSYVPSFHCEIISSPYVSLIATIPFNHITLLPLSLQSNCLANDTILAIMKGNSRSITSDSLNTIRKVVDISLEQMSNEEKLRNLILDHFDIE